MSDVIIPLAPMNTSRICQSTTDDLAMLSERWIEIDITDEHAPAIIKVPKHQMLIEVSLEGILVKSVLPIKL